MKQPPSLFDDPNLFREERAPYSGNPLAERSAYRKKRNLEKVVDDLIKDAMLTGMFLIEPVVLKLKIPSLTEFGHSRLNILTTAYLIAIAFALHGVKKKDRLTTVLFSDLLVALEIVNKEIASAVVGCIESCGLIHDDIVQFVKDHFPGESEEEQSYRVVFQEYTEWLRTGLYGTIEGTNEQQGVLILAAKKFYNEHAKRLLTENK